MSHASLITAAVIAVVFGAMLAGEAVAPLRRTVEPKQRRVARNLTVAGISLAFMTLLQAPLLTPVTSWTGENRAGLLNQFEIPPILESVLAVVLFDYTLWIWHWLSHKVPFLWRFHLVHHIDRDLDSSTALRFHYGELILSIAYRALQIVVIGADARSLWTFQTILFASILFHHSNLRLPEKLERVLVRVLVTPRMHGIHHSDRRAETDSNWASLLTIWDVLHRTFRMDVPQETITIGVPAYRDSRDVTIGKILLLPFRRQRDDWARG
jgi:sterol desaturase/sphingolipid hydroxylase (fatty acid hydroxylase superfamily)